MQIETARLYLRPFQPDDSENMAALMRDAEVTADIGGPLAQADSDARLARYIDNAAKDGTARLAAFTQEGVFIGYAGLARCQSPHPLADAYDIGWRLMRSAWGQGYATEAAGAIVRAGFNRLGLDRILAYTAEDNQRSQAVARKLGMSRLEALDFPLDRLGITSGKLAWVWTLARPA